jgi:hypothetical protein
MPIPAFGFVDNDALIPADSTIMEQLVQHIARFTTSPLLPTALRTTNYSAQPFDYVQASTFGGSFSVVLPNAPLDKTIIGVQLVATGGGNLLVTTSGTDAFQIHSGPTVETLTNVNETLIAQYSNPTGIWSIISHSGSVAPNSAIAIAIALG